jgi:hypothetical protein
MNLQIVLLIVLIEVIAFPVPREKTYKKRAETPHDGEFLPKPGAIASPKGFFLRTGRVAGQRPVNTPRGDQEISLVKGLFQRPFTIDVLDSRLDQRRSRHVTDLHAHHGPTSFEGFGDGGKSRFMKSMVRIGGTVFFHHHNTFAADFLLVDFKNGERFGLAKMKVDRLPRARCYGNTHDILLC